MSKMIFEALVVGGWWPVGGRPIWPLWHPKRQSPLAAHLQCPENPDGTGQKIS